MKPSLIALLALALAAALYTVEAAERFQLRARVTKIEGRVPAVAQKFIVGYGGISAKTTGNAWSSWLPCTEQMWNNLRREYPNNGRTNPMVFWLGIKGVKDTSLVEVEARFPKKPKAVFRMPGELFAPGMGLAVYQEAEQSKIASFAQYNRRFWVGLKEVAIPLADRPKHFPIVDSIRTRGGANRLTFREGFAALASAGFNVLGPEVHQPQVREELVRLGITRTGGGTFTAPGWVCNYGPETDVERGLTTWAQKQADTFRKSGWDSKQVVTFALTINPMRKQNSTC